LNLSVGGAYANTFSSVFGAPIHKKIIMSSVESGNEDCNCDVVVLEQPHCNLLHLIALNSGDATGERTPMVDDDSQTKKIMFSFEVDACRARCNFQGWKEHSRGTILDRSNQLDGYHACPPIAGRQAI
jgi:hypothetical protein